MRSYIIAALALAACNAAPNPVPERKPNTLHLTHESDSLIVTEAEASAPEPVKKIESAIKSLDAAHYPAAIKDNDVVIEFYADWCAVCVKAAPAVERLARRHPGFTFYRVNVDAEPDLTESLDVALVPALVLFKRGTFVDTITGEHSDAAWDRFLVGDML